MCSTWHGVGKFSTIRLVTSCAILKMMQNKQWPNSTAPLQHSRKEVEGIVRIREEKDRLYLKEMANESSEEERAFRRSQAIPGD